MKAYNPTISLGALNHRLRHLEPKLDGVVV